MKTCCRCKIEKPPSEFNKNKRNADGLRAGCRECQSLEYQANREKVIARSAAWAAQNKEKRVQHKSKWRANNPDYGKAHYRENKGEYAIHARRWQQENKEKVAARNLKWKEANPEKVSSQRQNRRAAARLADGSHTHEDIASIFSNQSGRCAYCQCALKRAGKGKMHIDHIMPLALGGSNWPSNLQLLCPACNLSKGAKHPIDFAQSMGKLL